MNAQPEAITNTRAWTTFAGMLLPPVIIFGIAALLILRQQIDESWSTVILTYIVGTTPGLIFAVRYPGTTAIRVAAAISYLLTCAGFLFAEFLTLGCWLSDVCP